MEKGSDSRVALKIDIKAKKKANKRKKAKRKYGKSDVSQENDPAAAESDYAEEGDEHEDSKSKDNEKQP